MCFLLEHGLAVDHLGDESYVSTSLRSSPRGMSPVDSPQDSPPAKRALEQLDFQAALGGQQDSKHLVGLGRGGIDPGLPSPLGSRNGRDTDPDTTNGTAIYADQLGWCQGGQCRHIWQSHGVYCMGYLGWVHWLDKRKSDQHKMGRICAHTSLYPERIMQAERKSAPGRPAIPLQVGTGQLA